LLWDPVERFFYGIAVSLLIIGGIIYFIKARQRDNKNERILLYGFSCWMFGCFLLMGFSFLADFYFRGNYINYAFYGDVVDRPYIYNLLNLICLIGYMAGLMFFLFSFEIVAKKSKYLMTITELVFIVAMIIMFSVDIVLYVNSVWIFTAINAIFILVVFFWIARNSDLEFQTIIEIMIIGLSMFSLGAVLNTREVKSFHVFPLFIPPLILMFGIIIMISPIYINPMLFKESLKYSKNIYRGLIAILIFYTITSTITVIFLLITPQIPIMMPLSLLFQNCVVILFLLNFRKQRTKSKIGIIKVESYLEVFAKPQKVTEKEVWVSQERKICLVCKGKVGGIIFMCSNCGSYYCLKCTDAITNLEKVCWACNEAIDPSKPVIPFEEEEKKIDRRKLELEIDQ
jgi:hypothetical protein